MFCLNDSLDNHENRNQNNDTDNESVVNSSISLNEMRQAARKLRKGKSTGYDEIPAEVLCYDSCLSFLHKFFRIFFERCIVQSQWGIGIINLIQKSNCTDIQDPHRKPRNHIGFRGL